MDANDNRAAELAEIVRQIRERVRAGYPEGSAAGVALPDLMPVAHARDAAFGKVAAIGTVNPRRGGPLNALIQAIKKVIARSLEWHIREQVEFNRAILRCVDAMLEAQNESNRALAELARRIGALKEPFDRETQAMRDVVGHWQSWRGEWEDKLARNEIRFLRSVAETQAADQQRTSLMEANFRELLVAHHEDAKAALKLAREMEAGYRDFAQPHQQIESRYRDLEARVQQIVESQHREFTRSLDVASREIQARLWKDLERIQLEYQALIHHELRLIRQRSSLVAHPPPAASTPVGVAAPNIDWLLFAQKFRGTEEKVKRSFERYVPRFRECRGVIDLGCGRGEFLDLMHEAGIEARGVDLSAECVALCKQRGHEAEMADIFRYLEELPDASVGGIFCAQVIEHLQPAQVPELIGLCAQKLGRGSPLVFETPNPECLAIFATHFYLDPTHVRPVPPALLAFYMEEAGLGRIEVMRLSPAVDSMPSIEKLPMEFRHQFFNGLDYAISAKRVV